MPDRAAGYRPLPVESVCCCCHTWHLTPGHGSVDGHTESWDIEILKKKKKSSTHYPLTKISVNIQYMCICYITVYYFCTSVTMGIMSVQNIKKTYDLQVSVYSL